MWAELSCFVQRARAGSSAVAGKPPGAWPWYRCVAGPLVRRWMCGSGRAFGSLAGRALARRWTLPLSCYCHSASAASRSAWEALRMGAMQGPAAGGGPGRGTGSVTPAAARAVLLQGVAQAVAVAVPEEIGAAHAAASEGGGLVLSGTQLGAGHVGATYLGEHAGCTWTWAWTWTVYYTCSFGPPWRGPCTQLHVCACLPWLHAMLNHAPCSHACMRVPGSSRHS